VPRWTAAEASRTAAFETFDGDTLMIFIGSRMPAPGIDQGCTKMKRWAVSRAGAQRRRSARGFTLIEVLITIAIVAILASVAYPSYTDYIRRSHVQEAPSQLMAYRATMEQYYQDHRSYAEGSECGVAVPQGEYFDYSCTTSNAGQAYTATATGAGGTVSGLSYSINQVNQRSSSCSGCAWNFGTVDGLWVLRRP